MKSPWHSALVGPLQKPVGACGPLFLNLGRILNDPPIERGMIDGYPSLAPHLLKLPIRYGIGHIPPDAPQNDFLLKLASLKVDHVASLPPYDQWSSIADHPSSEKL